MYRSFSNGGQALPPCGGPAGRQEHLLTVIYLLLTAVCGIAVADQVTRVVPVFAEKVPGANGSIWQSELHFYNSTSATQTITSERVFPYQGSTCSGFSSFTIAPGALAQLRSIGCGTGAGAVEIVTDSGVAIDTTITNTGNIVQDRCCLSGFTEAISVDPATYSQHWTLANLQVALKQDVTAHLGRHNLGIVNPNDVQVTVALRYFDATGSESPFPFLGQTVKSVTVPPRSLIQINDVLPFEQAQITPPHTRGFWRIEASATSNVYMYDSYVDNTTNDATFIHGQ
jgi:hypothetical protein